MYICIYAWNIAFHRNAILISVHEYTVRSYAAMTFMYECSGDIKCILADIHQISIRYKTLQCLLLFNSYGLFSFKSLNYINGNHFSLCRNFVCFPNFNWAFGEFAHRNLKIRNCMTHFPALRGMSTVQVLCTHVFQWIYIVSYPISFETSCTQKWGQTTPNVVIFSHQSVI